MSFFPFNHVFCVKTMWKLAAENGLLFLLGETISLMIRLWLVIIILATAGHKFG